MRPYLKKKPSRKRACGVAQGIGPEFKLPIPKKNKNSETVKCNSQVDALTQRVKVEDKTPKLKLMGTQVTIPPS
jgi:hypothetical protein